MTESPRVFLKCQLGWLELEWQNGGITENLKGKKRNTGAELGVTDRTQIFFALNFCLW